MSNQPNITDESAPRPFLSVDELRNARISEVKKGGLNPAEVALLIERAASTFQALLDAIDTLHAERSSMIEAADTQAAIPSEPPSATAARVIAAAADAADSIIKSAEADAELLLAKSRTELDQMRDEVAELVAEKESALTNHRLEVAASRESANAELARMQAQLAIWRDDFASRSAKVLESISEVFDNAAHLMDTPVGEKVLRAEASSFEQGEAPPSSVDHEVPSDDPILVSTPEALAVDAPDDEAHSSTFGQ